MSDFSLSCYDYTLPEGRIATQPASPRESARLLVYERASGRVRHSDFYHLCDFIPRGTLVVLNNTKVIKARLHAHKIHSQTLSPNEKRLEIFFHRFQTKQGALCQIRGRVREGDWLKLDSTYYARVESCLPSGLRLLRFVRVQDSNKNAQDIGELVSAHTLSESEILSLLEARGSVPLPPYIKREANAQDEEDYQSVFATHLGAVAAPTASLHFSRASLEELKARFDTCAITLHVGAGTFLGVESEDIREHRIHSESYSIEQGVAEQILNAPKVLCVGTTSARCVEHYARSRVLSGECELFLYPGQDFLRTDFLLTNFHLPKSTLLMLVSAMIGREKCLELYALALKEGYTFYSYGDGMLIL